MSDYTNIYERATARESSVWNPFHYNGPFSTLHASERDTVFGLYAGTYLHGMGYLQAIQSEDLQRLVDAYDANMAVLTNEEAQLVLEISAKRYLEGVEAALHDSKMQVEAHKIDALNDEYDAKMEALSADEAALETKRYEIEVKRDEIQARITELKAAIQIEDVNQEMVGLDISQKELEKARVDLEIVEAGLRGLDIQLSITQTGIEMANTDVQIADAENRASEVDLQIAEVALEESELENKEDEIELQEAEESGYRKKEIEVGIRQVAARIVDIQTDEAELAVKEAQIDVDIQKIAADGAKLELADSDLAVIEAQKRAKEVEKRDIATSRRHC
jgi:chromosome segregation ATPase